MSTISKKRELGEPVAVKALSIGRSPERFKLYDITREDETEIEKYMIWIKQYTKLYKAMFHKYA